MKLKSKQLIIIAAAIAVLGIVIVAVGPGSGPTTLPALEGYEAPDISLQNLEGGPWTLSGEKGKVLFINFWATW